MRRALAIGAAALVAGCAAGGPSRVTAPREAPAAAATLFAGVHVFDGLSEERSEPQDVLVAGGKVRAIGAPGTVEAPPDAVRIDGAGRTLLPGLVDLHVRIGLGDGAPPWAGRGIDARQAAGSLLWAGVTTALVPVREADLEALNAAIREGAVGGPRLYRGGKALASEDGGPLALHGVVTARPESKGVHEIDDPREAARATRTELEYRRPTFVTVSFEPGPDGARPTAEDLRAAVAEAAHYGRRVLALAPAPGDAVVAAEHGASLILAVPWTAAFTAEQAQRLADTGVPVVTAVRAPGRIAAVLRGEAGLSAIERGALTGDRAGAFAAPPEGVPAEAARAAATFAAGERTARENLALLREAGVPLLAGSGAGLPGLVHGAALHEELGALVDLGVPPAEALLLATAMPARFLDPLLGIGVIAPGGRADLLLVEGDPTADVAATRSIVGVWQGGWQVPRADQRTTKTPTAR